MDYLQALGAAVTFGSALGATVAGFFAYRQKSLVTLLRESNTDYKERVSQLEGERDSMNIEIAKLKGDVKRLETERRLPLDKLTRLIIEQHSQSQTGLEKLATQVGELAKAIGNQITEKVK